MPQIFPLNWLMITTLIMILLIFIMSMTFFIKSFKSYKKTNEFNKNNLSFKW